jgi:hypothetical protein
VDNKLFFGACALLARDGKNNYISLSKDKWNKIYEYLFGGFESLVTNNDQDDDDDDEEDELATIPKNKKTRDGYLKDGFVVDGGVGCDSDVDVACNGDGDESDEVDTDDSDSDSSSEGDKSSNNNSEGEGEGEGHGDGEEEGTGGIYCNKKNRNILNKGLQHNSKSKSKIRNKNTIVEHDKHILKEDDDDDNSGWNTDESSELSEDEYSYC